MTTREEDLLKQEEIWKIEEEVIEDFNNGLLSVEERDEKIAEILEEVQ